MRRPIVMPDLGPGDVTFNLWLVGPGQKVYEGDRVAEVLLDAATLDVLSPADGKVAETLAGTQTLAEAAERVGAQDSVFFSSRFIVPRPLMQAITSEKPTLLLVDEVDKSDPEFEAFLLEVLSDFQVSVPELGTLTAQLVDFVHQHAALLVKEAAEQGALAFVCHADSAARVGPTTHSTARAVRSLEPRRSIAPSLADRPFRPELSVR